jgi:hypothetical protein
VGIVLAVVLYGAFGLGALAAVVGLVYAVVRKRRDKRTPEQRWADEHGDGEGENPYRLGSQLVNGITFGSRR